MKQAELINVINRTRRKVATTINLSSKGITQLPEQAVTADWPHFTSPSKNNLTTPQIDDLSRGHAGIWAGWRLRN